MNLKLDYETVTRQNMYFRTSCLDSKACLAEQYINKVIITLIVGRVRLIAVSYH